MLLWLLWLLWLQSGTPAARRTELSRAVWYLSTVLLRCFGLAVLLWFLRAFLFNYGCVLLLGNACKEGK